MLRKLSLRSNAPIFWVNSAQWASHTQSQAGCAIGELISFVGVMQIRLTRETRGGASFSTPKGKGGEWSVWRIRWMESGFISRVLTESLPT